MKLRYRLFFLVGGIFFIAFILSVFLESWFTKKKLLAAQKDLQEQIENTEKWRATRLQDFIALIASQDVAEIDATLKVLSPSADGVEQPSFASSILKTNPKIDFLQVTLPQAAYVLLPDISLIKEYLQAPCSEHLRWLKIANSENGQKLLGLLIDDSNGAQKYILVDPSAIEQARGANIADLHVQIPLLATSLKEALKGPLLDPPFPNPDASILKLDPCVESDYPYLQTFSSMLITKKKMVGILDVLFQASSLLKSIPLLGIVEFDKENVSGFGVATEDVLIKRQLFDSTAFLKDHPPNPGCNGLGKAIALIDGTPQKNVFLGNSRLMEDDIKYQLTAGSDVSFSVNVLAILLRETCLLSYEGNWMEGFSPLGKKLLRSDFSSLPLDDLMATSAGEVSWNGKEYFFLHLAPFQEMDLHFFLLNPIEQEFLFLKSFERKSKEVISQISIGMRAISVLSLIAVLIALHSVSNRIIDPITHLADATQKVRKGHFSEIKLPSIAQDRHDEVSSLYHSFADMVKGLIEKDKVQSVLNKVVSPEVAGEILKGELHLGGEEKIVSVFFADIRNFTGMSEHMPPHEVIELLNNCMTRISRVIEEHHGVIDKYVGDEVMALFGAPLKSEHPARNAVDCALETIQVLNRWNIERVQQGKAPVKMGVGIATGLVVAGNMGAEDRLNYTVLGRNVNLASRLCQSAEGMEILISEETWNAPGVKENIRVEKKGMLTLKGFAEAIPVYKVLNLV